MKGILTFTLAAGVAISTTTVVHGAGLTKGVANVSKAPASAQAPQSITGLGMALDRQLLHRELSRLTELLVPEQLDEVVEGTTMPTTVKTAPVWTY